MFFHLADNEPLSRRTRMPKGMERSNREKKKPKQPKKPAPASPIRQPGK